MGNKIRTLYAAALLALPVSALALEEVIITGPGAGETAQPQKDAPARPSFAREAEMRETRNYLDLLLEYGDRVPAEKLEELARDAAKFTSAVKKTLGGEILAEAAARQKAAEGLRRTAAAKKVISDVRYALQVTYGERGGKYPAHPWEMVPGRFKLPPGVALPDHELTSEVRLIDSKKRHEDLGKAVNDEGGWVYFSNPDSEHYGLLLLNCSHKDRQGTEFFRY
jgi:hypothetical protein